MCLSYVLNTDYVAYRSGVVRKINAKIASCLFKRLVYAGLIFSIAILKEKYINYLNKYCCLSCAQYGI